MKIQELLRSIPKKYREDAIWLLMSRLSLSRSSLALEAGRELPASLAKEWPHLWARRLAGEPLQYVAGSAPFYGREFLVRKGVLIPRPETECLVELALSQEPSDPCQRVLDIGTGSGAIAITLKLERPRWDVTATDISPHALKIAKANARFLGAEVNFSKEDLFSPRLRRLRFSLVVSNPPYLDFKKDLIAKDVRKWEPRLALEPESRHRVSGVESRAAWCGERILAVSAASGVKRTILELSPRVAWLLERRWRSHDRVERMQRLPDLAGRKRFLLVAWKNA